MGEQRCPMCSKNNPPEAENCLFCQARLKPLIGSASEGEGGTHQSQASTPIQPSDPDDSLPDWLRELRQPKDEDDFTAESSPAEEPLPADDSTDWLSRLGGLGDAPRSNAFEYLDEEDTEGQPGGESLPGENLPEGILSEDNLPDWLTGIDSVASTLAAAEAASLQGDDWLNRVRARKQADGPEDGEKEDLFSAEPASDFPDWLRGSDSPAQDVTEAESSSGLPDWLAGAREYAAEQPAEPETDRTPDWLSSSSQDVEGSQVEPAPGDAGDLPDWLSAGFERGDVQQPEAEINAEPDWMAAGQAGAEPGETGAIPGATDWQALSQASPEASEPEAEPGEAEAESDEIPGWLSAGLGEAEPGLVEAESDDLPAWLSTGAGDFPSLEDDTGLEAAQEEQPATPTSEMPAWLSQLAPQGMSIPDEPEEDPGTDSEAKDDSDTPDWLSRMDRPAFETPPERNMPALILDDEQDAGLLDSSDSTATSSEPEWLSHLSTEDAPAQPLETENAGLAPAQLPSWLEAMRPVGSAAPSGSVLGGEDNGIENAGPLAGLRGVLPAEPEYSRVRKGKALSLKIQVSEAQRANIAILESLVASEKEAKPLPSRAAFSSQLVLRVFIALVLFAIVLTGLSVRLPLVPLPAGAQVPSEVQAAARLVANVQPGAPVLVAFDYEPGLVGELESTSSAALAQLAAKNAYLAVVSTSPTGPLAAERALQRISAGQNGQPVQYINLGYIPGGATGLRAFVEDPRSVMPYGLDSQVAWEGGPLEAVQSLANFGLVMVITENPDTARIWIEQVQPALQSDLGARVPMIMLVSAQAEPMVQPYLAAGGVQIDGMVSGVAGGAAFEGYHADPRVSAGYWNAFTLGLMAAVGLFILLGFINLMAGTLTRGKGERESAA